MQSTPGYQERLAELEQQASDADDLFEKAATLIAIGRHTIVRDAPRAQSAIAEALGMLDGKDQQILRFDAHLLSAEIDARSGRSAAMKAGLASVQQAMDDLDTDHRTPERVLAAERLRAFLYHRLNDAEAALEADRRARDAAQECGDEKGRDLATVHMANILYQCGRGSEALPLLDEVEKRASVRHDSLVLCKTHRCRGGIYDRSGNLGKAIAEYRAALPELLKSGETLQLAGLYHDLSAVYRRIDDLEQGLEMQIEALALFRSAKSQRGIAYALNNIGDIKLTLGDAEEALVSLEESCSMKRELGEVRGLVVTLRNIGRAHVLLGSLDLAEKSLAEAESLARSIDDPNGLVLVLIDQARVSMALKHAADTAERSAEGLQLARDIGDIRSEAELQIISAEASLLADRTAECIEILQRVEQSASSGDNAPLMPRLHRIYAKAHEAIGNYREALAHDRRAATLDLEIREKASKERMQHALVAHDTEHARADRKLAEQRAEIVALENDRLLKEAEMQSKELMATALFLTQKNEVLRDVAKELQQIVSREARGIGPDVESLRQRVVEATEEEASWNIFEEQFSRVHEGFLEAIATAGPELTPTEIRVCALARTGLSIKETASILTIEIRSVEKYRQRARKKLGLERSTNLVTYLQGLQG